MGKYGFVYIWRDSKLDRYYIGSHWGNEDDGYVCSSNWMRNAYRRRPQDFKRRIIKRITSNRSDMLKVEQRWLNMINYNKIRKGKDSRYYNLSLNVGPAWQHNIDVASIAEKVSKTKNFWLRKESVYKNRISCFDAKKQGLKRYFTGEPCKRGHVAERTVSNRQCVECYRKNYEVKKDYYIEKANFWKKKNPERRREISRNWARQNG